MELSIKETFMRANRPDTDNSFIKEGLSMKVRFIRERPMDLESIDYLMEVI